MSRSIEWDAIYRGDGVPLQVTLLDTSSDALDLTGYDARFEVDYSDCKITVTDTTITSTAGTIDGVLLGSQTQYLPYGKNSRVSLVLIDPSTIERTFRLGVIPVVE